MMPGRCADHSSSCLKNSKSREKEDAEDMTNSLRSHHVLDRLRSNFYHHGHLVGSTFASGAVDIVVGEDGDDNGVYRVEVTPVPL